MVLLEEGLVCVREFREEDIENKVNWINDNKNNRYLHYEIPLSFEKTLAWFQNKADNRIDCTILFDNIPVGVIGLLGIDEKNKKAEFYITLGRNDFKRKGIATIATKLVLGYAFEVLSLNKVFLNVDEENEPACRLYEKIGFQLEGRFVKDLIHNGVFINRLRYALLAEKFKGDC